MGDGEISVTSEIEELTLFENAINVAQVEDNGGFQEADIEECQCQHLSLLIR